MKLIGIVDFVSTCCPYGMEMIVIQLEHFLDRIPSKQKDFLIHYDQVSIKMDKFWIHYNQRDMLLCSMLSKWIVLAMWISVIQCSYQLAFVSRKFHQSLGRS